MIKGSAFDNGYLCASIGKSIHYNPFRNTKEDKEKNAYKNWNDGWKKYHANKNTNKQKNP